ncbi:hypothetical protein DFH06DRAFT_1142296 [Mycena polygramma]|nr:hypothetical protein DFH06DRAFT_1142296 [Mycena polygramma]
MWYHTGTLLASQTITGVLCPMTPITPELYKAYRYPWFDLYDERLPTVHHKGAFSAVRSIGKLDNATCPSYNVIDPESPPNCSRHKEVQARYVSRPCGHTGCATCLGESFLAGSGDLKCGVCAQKVEKQVLFDKPLPKLKRGGGSEGSWWEAEAQIDGVPSGSDAVITLILDEDSVSRLHGATKPRPPPCK